MYHNCIILNIIIVLYNASILCLVMNFVAQTLIHVHTRENIIIYGETEEAEECPLRGTHCVIRKWRRIFVLSGSTRSMVRVHWPVTCRSTHCLLSMCWHCIDCFVCAMDDGVRVYNAEPLVEKCRIGVCVCVSVCVCVCVCA